MAKITLCQHNVTAKLSEVYYEPAEGFQADNTWHVAEEAIVAQSDAMLEHGPATLLHKGREYPVTVTVFTFEAEDEPEEDEPVCSVELSYAEGVEKLAEALGLLED